jgi:hypothetical protein
VATTSAESAATSLWVLYTATALDGAGLVRAPSDFGLAATGSTSLPRQGADALTATAVSKNQSVPSASAPHRVAARAGLDQVFADQDANRFSETLRMDEIPAWAV